jgi:uncharacterized protein
MIVYQATKKSFIDDILSNDIENIIHREFQRKLNRKTQVTEINSWKHSMQYMSNVLADPGIPDQSGVSIEFQIPQTSNRIDFIITGKNESQTEYALIIELKAWSSCQLTGKDAIVKTILNRGYQETSHPSYQAWSYAALLKGFNQTVYEESIELQPCAYLHNYAADGIIDNEFYQYYVKKAPLFLKSDARKLQDFIKRYIKYGDDTSIMYRIDSGKIKPSKALADSIGSMIKGNDEFIMIDDQKVVFENALALANQSSENDKNVLIVEGGPGTGKSVVAINLLVKTTKKGLVTQYVSKNAAPRAVYESKLTGTLRKTEISNLFKGSGAFVNSQPNEFDVLIVDEAHRLNEKSGLYKNLGVNQIKELIRASKFSVFFIDEDQRVTLHDIGDKMLIGQFAKKEGASVHYLELSTQFRCNGSDGYLAWLDNILQISETANNSLAGVDFDFQIFDSSNKLRDEIIEKNKINNKARMVAGYCWDWNSRKNKNLFDIVIPEHDFKARWNLSNDGSLWIVSPNSVHEVGCIHTCQGLEVDYIGVIVGKDLIVRDGLVITDAGKRSKMDMSVRGYKSLSEKDPIGMKIKLDKIIKNTYRTLMTRGMKGCYAYFQDKETQLFFENNN